jgi:hypothetical protein
MNIELPRQPSGIISREEILSLASHRGGPHISIYLPTQRVGPATRENPIRLKNLLTEAEEALIAGGTRPTEARDMLERARALEDDYDFWQHQAEGLSIHIAPGLLRMHRLPLALPELAIVGDRFHLRPLLELFTADAHFYLLALSMNDIRVFRCARYSEQELSVAEMPRNMADALWPDDPERQQQFRDQPVSQASGKEGEFGVFHGSGDIVEDEVKDRLFRYFRQVDQALHHLLRNESAPLVLAAVHYLQPIYAEANTYRNLVQEGVAGNPEGVGPDELRMKAWQLVEPQLRRQREAALERFGTLQGTGRTSTQIEEIAREAARGRVDTLFAAQKAIAWASVSDDGESIELHGDPRSGDEDLVDYVAIKALTHGGRLYTLDQAEMPDRHLATAIFRY